MKIGVHLPHSGPDITAEKILDSARRAEAAGVSSVSVIDRLLYPTVPSPGPNGDPGFPPAHQVVLYDPLETLAAVAAVTERVELLTAVIDVLFQSPLLLAKRLATVDQFSGGRLVVGIGQGWVREEFEASNVPLRRRGAGFDEHIAAVRAAWGPDPVQFEGRFYRIPTSHVGPKPVRPGGPPLLVGSSAPAVLSRAAAWADGLLPVVSLGQSWSDVEGPVRLFLDEASALGREGLEVRLRAHTRITDRPIEGERTPTNGSVEQVIEDLQRLEELGVTEVTLNQTLAGVPFDEQIDSAVAVLEAIRRDELAVPHTA